MGFSLSSAIGGVLGSHPFQELGEIGQKAGGANFIGSTLNDLMGTSDAAKQTYNYNQLSADRDMQRSIYLWNMQNAYNHPAAQIARMAEAGIDVNPMTYAVGNGNMSTTASNISAPGTGSVSVGSHGINPISALMSVLSGIQGLKATDAQIKEVEAQKKHIEAQTRLVDKQMTGQHIHNVQEDQRGIVGANMDWLQLRMMRDAYNAYKEEQQHRQGRSYRWSRNVGEWISSLSPFITPVADDASYKFFSRFGGRK